MKTLLVRAVAIAAIAAFTPALASPGVTSATAPKAKAATAKQAKAVTRAQMVQGVQRHFARLDTNRDGFVTKAEADAAAMTSQNRIADRNHRRGTAMFERLDTNKDGVVTRAEAEPFFAQGSVDIAHSGPGDRKPRRNWDALAAQFDANKDGSISRAEFDSGRAHRAKQLAERRPHAAMRHAGLGGRVFEAADADKDGRVSLAEATAAAAARFDAADANRDGTITPDEMRQARQKARSTTSAR